MEKRFYQNYYKLQLAMQDHDENIIIFGPASSGKCDALEKCIEDYGKEKNMILLTSKTALMIAAYNQPSTTCLNWEPSMKRIDPKWIKNNPEIIIIDGYCENWKEIIESFPSAKFIMAVRVDGKKDLDDDLKKNFRILAKSGYTNSKEKTKGITQVTFYKG